MKKFNKYALIAQGARNPYTWGLFASLRKANAMKDRLNMEQGPYFIFWVTEMTEKNGV